MVCTDAHGNRDYCVDGVNCLMPDATPGAVASALARLLADPQLRLRLGEAARTTAAGYDWPTRIDALERFLRELDEAYRVLGDARRDPVEHPEAEDEHPKHDGERLERAPRRNRAGPRRSGSRG